MYLRYREPSWETSDVADTTPLRRVASARSRAAAARRATGLEAGLSTLTMPTVDLLGLKVHAITEVATIAHILSEINAGRGGVVVTPNLDHLRRYLTDVNFRVLVAEADLVVADGMPLVWASRLQGTPLPERVAGSNLISSLSEAAARQSCSIFLLGGSEGTAEGAARVLTERSPSLKIAGWHTPSMGFENKNSEMAVIFEKLAASQPQIVYVALGSPKQEKLIAKLRHILPNAWWLGVGNSFSFLGGDVKRAPLWMQKTGMEWAHRLMQEPGRLFGRYVTSGMPFAITFLGRSAVRGIPNRFFGGQKQQADATSQRLGASSATLNSPLGATEALLAEPAAVLSAIQPPSSVTTPVDGPVIRVAWPSAPAETERPSDDTAPLSRLRSMILLGGTVRTNPLSSATTRSVLDLPLDESGSILNFWLSQAAEVARMANLDQLPVRVMVDQNSPEPRSADARYAGAYRVERDLSEYRGTGGVLRDIASSFEDEDLILVVNAAQVLLDPLPVVIATLQRKRGDISVVSHDDGTPSGIMLIKCKTLRLLPEQGFVDMKEQGLPLIAGKFDVRVVKRRRPTGLPARSLEGYIQALHYYHRRRSGKPAITDPLAEDWSPSFSLVEKGANVDPSARIHDSIVLAGGTVEAGAVLVRSLVCPGATVRRDRTAVDQLVCREGGPRKAEKAAQASGTNPK